MTLANFNHLLLTNFYNGRRKQDEKKNIILRIVLSLINLQKINPESVYKVKTTLESYPEELKFAKKYLVRAFDLSIELMTLFLPFDLGFFTEEILANHSELRNYVQDNF